MVYNTKHRKSLTSWNRQTAEPTYVYWLGRLSKFHSLWFLELDLYLPSKTAVSIGLQTNRKTKTLSSLACFIIMVYHSINLFRYLFMAFSEFSGHKLSQVSGRPVPPAYPPLVPVLGSSMRTPRARSQAIRSSLVARSSSGSAMVPLSHYGGYLKLSWNRGTPKSSTFRGLSVINQGFLGSPIYGNTNIYLAGCQIPRDGDK